MWKSSRVTWRKVARLCFRTSSRSLAAAHTRCRGGEGRGRLSGALYVQRCACPGSGAALKRGEQQQPREPEQRFGRYNTDPTTTTTTTTAIAASARTERIHWGLHTDYSIGSRGVRKFGEMQSAYQHLISLLFVFSSMHVNQLTEGCSCALMHPQDAFCNSEIGEWRVHGTRGGSTGGGKGANAPNS